MSRRERRERVGVLLSRLCAKPACLNAGFAGKIALDASNSPPAFVLAL
jgi:hypothetical protein